MITEEYIRAMDIVQVWCSSCAQKKADTKTKICKYYDNIIKQISKACGYAGRESPEFEVKLDNSIFLGKECRLYQGK